MNDKDHASATVASLSESVRGMRIAIVGIVAATVVRNLLLLAVAGFVLLLPDSIIPARNMATLASLFLLTAAILVGMIIADILRAHMILDLSARIELDGAAAMPKALVYVAQRIGGADRDPQRPIHDLEDVRAFLVGPGPAALLDMPASLLAVVALFLLHFWFGVLAIAVVAAMAALTVITHAGIQRWTQWLAQLNAFRRVIAGQQSHHSDVSLAMGMAGNFWDRWMQLARPRMFVRQQLSRRLSTMEAVARLIRLLAFMAALAIGAALSFRDEASVGAIMCAAFLLIMMLSPMERALAEWGRFAAARLAWRRLGELLPLTKTTAVTTILPRPQQTIMTANLIIRPPGSDRAVIHGVGFQLDAGDTLGVIGPSGAGKTALLRGLMGIWPLSGGTVAFDGAGLEQWNVDQLSRDVGYVPQNAELISGTIAQNIARLDAEPASDDVIAAAQAAGVHDMILRLPDGYDTHVGVDGGALSAGQRLGIALARALYRDPFLVVIDDPGAGLDAEGEKAVGAAIASVRQRRGIVVLVACRISLLQHVEKVMVIRDGAITNFGPRSQAVGRMSGPQVTAKIVLHPNPEGGEDGTA